MALYRYNARDRENRKYKGVKEAGCEFPYKSRVMAT